MRLVTPNNGIDFRAKDIFGKPFQLSNLRGKRVVLSFFRDAACPFCNYRIYELTRQYATWQSAGLEVVVIFSDTSEQVRTHVAKRPRPFTMISDPSLTLYDRYGVEKSTFALFKALVFKLPEIVRGFATGGKATNNPHIKLVPADFLIDVDGQVVESWYGRNTADHIPMQRLVEFGSADAISHALSKHSNTLANAA